MKTERKNNFVVGEKRKVELYPGHVKLETEYLGREGDNEVFKIIEPVDEGKYVLMKANLLEIEQDGLLTYRTGPESVRVISGRYTDTILPNLNKLLQSS